MDIEPQDIQRLADIVGADGLLTGDDVRARPVSWADHSPCQALAIVRPAAASPREIHVTGHALPPDLIPVLEHEGGGPRGWTSLAAAHAFARRHGFQGAIFVEEPRAS